MDNEFWDNLGRKVTGAVDLVGKKTEEVVEITKLKNQQYAVERELSEKYEKAGRLLFEQYLMQGVVDENLASACEEIQERFDKLESILNEIEENRR